MPKAVLTAILFDHFKDLEVTAEQLQDIAAREISPVGPLCDMPGSATAAEKRELRAEDGKDVEAIGKHDSQNAGLIGGPIRLFLVMEAPIVKNNIK